MDEIEKLSWFVEFIAYCGNTTDNPRRKRFQEELKKYFSENNLEINGTKKTEKEKE